MDSFKVYIFRLPKKSVQPLSIEWNNNFINFLRQLRNPKTKYDTQRIEKEIQKINTQGIIVEREWLLEKLQELKA